jgi:hypothetical protein
MDLFSAARIERAQRNYDAVAALNASLANLDIDEVGGTNFESLERDQQRRVADAGAGPAARRVARPARPHQRLAMRGMLCGMAAFTEHKYDTERADRFPALMSEYYAPTFYRKLVPAGIALLRKTEATLHRMIPKMFLFQKKLADEAFRASLRQLLDDQFENLWEEVCRQRKWPSAPRNLFTVASRRSGKTSLLAAFCASMLVCVYRMTIIVYSVALRSAQEFVRLVQRYIQMTPEGRAMLTNPGGSERLALHGPAPEDERWIRSFPSGGKSQNVSF